MTRLTRAAIIITAISGVVIFVFKDVGRMLTTEGDFLVWTVPFSRRMIRLPNWSDGVFLLLPPLSFVVVIVVWGFVAMTFLAFRFMDWKFQRMAARANVTPSDTRVYIQDFAVSFFPTWLAVLILLVLGWAAWKVAPWGSSLLR